MSAKLTFHIGLQSSILTLSSHTDPLRSICINWYSFRI